MRFEIAQRRQIVEQIGLPAHDQLAARPLNASPACDSRLDQFCSQRIQFALNVFGVGFNLGAHLRQRMAAHPGIEIIGRADQR